MKTVAGVALVVLACIFSLSVHGKTPPVPYDLIVMSGTIVDGAGTPAFQGDVALLNGRIVAIGSIDAKLAREVINASGLIVAPGGIDAKSRPVIPDLEDPEVLQNLLTQGITTIHIGARDTAASKNHETANRIGRETMAGYFQLLGQKGLPINVAQSVSLSNVWHRVMRKVDRSPTSDDIRAMQDLIREAMKAGAIGVSTTGSSPSFRRARTDEIVALVKIAGEYGGGYFVRLRDKEDSFLQSMEEAIEIGKTASVPVHISSLQAADRMPLVLDRIRDAREQGQRVSTDINPSHHGQMNGQTISQATATAASVIRVKGRGRIAVGLAADLIVFDEGDISDSGISTPFQYPSESIKHVIVNGITALRDGKLTGNRLGEIVRGPGYQKEKAPHKVMTGVSDPRFSKIDLLMKECLAKQRVPGASLAITDHGRLVYSRGFGYADIEASDPVTPSTLFRIASLSKPITAVAIMQLVEAGALELEAPVFSILDNYETFLEGDTTCDTRLRDITIRHLLQHRGGWDRRASFDPMFRSIQIANTVGSVPPAGHDEIIRYMQGKRLDFTPGEKYVYSNFGYCLLGRVIEKLTGSTYQDYVKENVLKPLSITTMEIGRTAYQLRFPGESRYYDPYYGSSVLDSHRNEYVPQPYGAWPLEIMDSHGAWIATAEDLVKLASAFDVPEKCLLLTFDSIQQMFERPTGLAEGEESSRPNSIYYGLGWQVRPNAFGSISLQMHAGSLPGTSTMLIRRSDGRCYAVLFNARETPYSSQVVDEIFVELNEAIGEIKNWPSNDLFRD